MCKKYDQNSNVWKEKGRIPMFIKKGQNSNVYIDSARIPMFGRRISEFPCLKGYD